MARRLSRAYVVRAAVATAVFALPLLGTGVAQAAIAGASPESTTNRPDLVSATALSATSVDFCFDKVLNNSALTGANFLLGGYRSSRAVAATTASLELTVDTTGKCVRALFPATIGDIGQYTVGTVLAGGVTALTGVINTFNDSVGLTLPASLNPTHNGTAGFTVAPDLVSVLPDPTTNTITYTEDQAVSTAIPIVGPSFFFTRPGGSQCLGDVAAPVVSGNTVTVHFTPTGTCPVSDAARAGQAAGAIPGGSAADPSPSGPSSPPENLNVPASTTSDGTGVTALPDLTSVVLDPNGGAALNFTFNKPVAVVGQTAFDAVLSNGAIVPSATAIVTNITNTTTTVRATFANMSLFDEYVVGGAVRPLAVVETSPPTLGNVFDSRPAGGNVGAFARGFTTGADALSGIINTTTGVLSLNVDQRVFGGDPTNVNLIDSVGASVAIGTAGSLGFPTQAAGPETITFQFAPGQAATAKNVSLGVGSLLTAVPIIPPAGNPPAQNNVNQILSITSTASILRAEKHAKSLSRSQIAAIRARTRAEQKALLAKFIHRLQRHHKHHKHLKHR